MLESVVQWLNQVSAEVFWTCVAGLVLIDAVAAAVVVGTRSRELVNAWTSRVLAANLLLIGAGLGVPAAAWAAKLMANALLPGVTVQVSDQSKAAAAEPALPPPSQ
jgi:hypothetical protein